jgi:uncharacterized membrane protein
VCGPATEVAAAESPRRSLAKALSYRIFASLCTSFIVFAISGDISLSLSAGLLDTVVKLGLYFVHERMWSRIPFGREKDLSRTRQSSRGRGA